jgi:rubrerythrin
MGITFEDIVRFAIEEESGATELYKKMSSSVERLNAKVMFDELAAEEAKHKEFFSKLSKESMPDISLEKVTDLRISDYLVDIPFRPEMEYQDILIMAMKKEESAVKLYSDMATRVQEPELQKLLKFMAQEEAKHKLRLETEYDDIVLAED